MTRFFRLLVLLASAVMLMSTFAASVQADQYVVEAGDSLSRLANRFDVSISQIRDWNDLSNDMIRIGQELTIHPGSAGSSGTTSYVVEAGDTCSGIASRFDVSVADLQSWNDGLNPDRIRVGQEISIHAFGRVRRTITYEIQPGDFVGRVARRFDVSISDIVRWNPGLDPDRVRIGDELRMVVEGPEERSESVGSASGGRLVHGERLPPHRLFEIRNDDLAWGTNETIAFLLDGFDHVRREHSDAPRVEVHDLSDEDGGLISGHRSHQSGRDADIGYFRNDCGRSTCEYERLSADELDAELNWSLLRHWIRHDQIQYVFIDYSLQEPLYDHARDHGASERQLNEWFQYPHGRRRARGLIRHEPNHVDHMHVRFSCSSSDDDCR